MNAMNVLPLQVTVAATLAVVAAALAPATVVVPLFPLALSKLWPADRMSVNVTFCAVLGPRFTSVTV